MILESLNDLPSVRAYLNRIGAEPRSLKVAVIKEMMGAYWADKSVIRFDRDGTVSAPNKELPTDLEAAAIKADFAGVTWPKIKPLHRIINPPLMIKNTDPKDVFEFKNENGEIALVQVRIEVKGERSYIPWTYWDDDKWRCAEPDGDLPLWGLENIKGASTAFIHEGAKAARRMQQMISGESYETDSTFQGHPWSLELSGAVHLGWIGGALSPQRTDWSTLLRNGIKRVYIVADNDAPGRSAVPGIAERIRIPTFMIQFTDEFPRSFDLGDDFPERMFRKNNGVKHYIGPAFRDCLHPATWATDLWTNPQGGKPTPVLRDSFKNMWSYVEEADAFVCTEMPEIMRTEAILNKMLAAFSHSSETCKLIVKNYRGRSTKICYSPDQSGLTVTFKGSSAINLHVPTTIRSTSGDPTPWLDFMDYLFVKKSEKYEVLRWCATLIARPDIRMGYGILLVSEAQGAGKNTLANIILAPLVGYNNVGYAGEDDILSQFNDWIANKRLVIVPEIYSGHSWKAYNRLKSLITDKELSVNVKFMRKYTIDIWAHILACSNSLRALKMEQKDRRWLYPEITELPWNSEKFEEFRNWLDNGGLSIIKHWAEQWGDYVRPSERAPMTDRKAELIDGSRSEAQRESAALAEAMNDNPEPVAITNKEIVAWVHQGCNSRVFDTDYELRRAMTEAGATVFPKRIKINARLDYVVMNAKLTDLVKRTEDEHEKARVVRASVVRPSEIMQGGM